MHELAFNAINCWRPTALFSLIFNEAVQLELKDIKPNLPVWLAFSRYSRYSYEKQWNNGRLLFTKYLFKIFSNSQSFLFSLFYYFVGS
jgi:hypothetical protein